jgi:hypothetical protein
MVQIQVNHLLIPFLVLHGRSKRYARVQGTSKERYNLIATLQPKLFKRSLHCQFFYKVALPSHDLFLLQQGNGPLKLLTRRP